MSDRIGIWSMARSESGQEVATPLEELQSTETEQRLEDLLVASPDVLVKGFRLIGRQVQTAGGPLDLLGVDPDGRIILFELKRGTLTREAVAQILDYASDLIERDPRDFAKLIEGSSGHLGVDRIDDFAEWFSTEFPNMVETDLDSLRMVLVGLGVDERAKRIVNLLARSGIDIQLLTFQAFRRGSEVLFARQVETVEPITRAASSGGTKQGNRRILEDWAREQEVRDLLIEVADFVNDRMPAYRWPNKTAFTFALNELTDEGRPTQRSYASVGVDEQQKGKVVFSLPTRAVEIAGPAVEAIVADVPEARLTTSSWTPFELSITLETWTAVKPQLDTLLASLVEAWEKHVAAADVNDSS